jgi:hypothetical protein
LVDYLPHGLLKVIPQLLSSSLQVCRKMAVHKRLRVCQGQPWLSRPQRLYRIDRRLGACQHYLGSLVKAPAAGKAGARHRDQIMPDRATWPYH